MQTITKPQQSNPQETNYKKRSFLLAHEDYWAIWIGAFLFTVGLIVFYIVPYPTFSEKVGYLEEVLQTEQEKAPYKSIYWHEAKVNLNELSSAKTSLGRTLKHFLSAPQKWDKAPWESFYKASVKQDLSPAMIKSISLSRKKAEELHIIAKRQNFLNNSANKDAELAAENWRKEYQEAAVLKKKNKQDGYNLIVSLPLLGIILGVLFGTGAYFLGQSFWGFLKAFILVFSLAVLAYFMGQQSDVSYIGFGYAFWAIAIGLLISNTIGTPEWAKPAVLAEFYIKTGLVLLGAEILLSKIMAIGLPGIFVSWFVTPIVLVSTFWFGQNVLKMASKTLNITISADMSVCGVSAAIATAAACKASKEELTVAVGLSIVFTSIMMVAMPTFIKFLGMPEVLGGAWIGGTIDASGAVVAAGAFLGDTALHVAATIKMIQNMLIGVISFFVAYYWAVKVDKNNSVKIGAGEIWSRFPKFILGFLGISLIVSMIYIVSGTNLGDALIEQGLIRGYLKDLTGWMFCLAFISIGLSVNFKNLKHHFKGGKPMYLYLIGQGFNLLLTLLMAYLMFYVFFEHITERL